MSTKMSLLAGGALIILALAGWRLGWRVKYTRVPGISPVFRNYYHLHLEAWRPSSARKERPGRAPGHSPQSLASLVAAWKRGQPKSYGESGITSTGGSNMFPSRQNPGG